MMPLEERLRLHTAFWDGSEMQEPLVSFRIGDYFFADKFEANKPLLVPQTVVTPDMIPVDAFLADYEHMYRECEETGQSGFFTAEPCTGFPWMEAMMGAKVLGAGSAFVTHPRCGTLEDLGGIRFDSKNPWAQIYFEFLTKLVRLSGGRFPVGQPILRGFSDCVGALIGQTELVYALMDQPALLRERFEEIAHFQTALLDEHYRRVSTFHGGYAVGFYHLWAHGKVIWYQDDLTALMSPAHYQGFVKEPSSKICAYCDYSLVHLHSSSFFHLDGILSLPQLKAVEINKDVGGLSVHQMIPEFRRVINAEKSLVVWGSLTKTEISEIMGNLPHKRLHFNLIVPTVGDAKELNGYIKDLWQA